MNKEYVKALRGLMIFAACLVLAVIHVDKIILVIGLILNICRPFLIGAAVAFVLNIPMKAIENKLFSGKGRMTKWKRPLSFLLALLAVAAVLGIVFRLVVPQLGVTISELAVKIPQFLAESVRMLQEVFDNNPQLQEYIAQLDFTSFDWNSILSKAANTLGSGLGSVLVSTFSVAGSIFSVVFDVVIAFVFAIYLLVQKDTLANQGDRVMHAYLSEKLCSRIEHILSLLYKNFSNFISSQCLEALILGAMFVVVMTVLGLPYAVLIGSLIAVTALVPIVGAFIGCGVGAFLILVEDPLLAVGFVVLFLLLQQIEGNLIYPRVVGSSVGLPAIWVLVAVSVGGSLFGVIGMLVFIPITSTLYTLLREDVNERNRKKSRRKAGAENSKFEADKSAGCKADGEEAESAGCKADGEKGKSASCKAGGEEAESAGCKSNRAKKTGSDKGSSAGKGRRKPGKAKK